MWSVDRQVRIQILFNKFKEVFLDLKFNFFKLFKNVIQDS